MAWLAEQLLVLVLIRTTFPQRFDVIDQASRAGDAIGLARLAQPAVAALDVDSVLDASATTLAFDNAELDIHHWQACSGCGLETGL